MIGCTAQITIDAYSYSRRQVLSLMGVASVLLKRINIYVWSLQCFLLHHILFHFIGLQPYRSFRQQNVSHGVHIVDNFFYFPFFSFLGGPFFPGRFFLVDHFPWTIIIHAPKIGVFGDFTLKMGSSMNETPKDTSLGGNTSYDAQVVKIDPSVRARREQKYKAKKFFILRNHNTRFSRVRQTTHIVTAPHGFTCVGIPATWLYIPSFIEIRSEVSEPQGVKIWPFPLL